MSQSFSVSLMSVALILLICTMVSTPFFRCGIRPLKLPITSHPDEFGDFGRDPAVWIKHDEVRFYEDDWVPQGDFTLYGSQIQNASRIVLQADVRLKFGAVRETLAELSKYRQDGIVLSTEAEYTERKPSHFELYLIRKSLACGCGW
jgi:biopolymer transport protein ExbD